MTNDDDRYAAYIEQAKQTAGRHLLTSLQSSSSADR